MQKAMNNTIHDCAFRPQSICGNCHKRPGQLVVQCAFHTNPSTGAVDPWVFRFYLCRYCRSADTRYRKLRKHGKPFSVIPHLPDSEVLKTLA